VAGHVVDIPSLLTATTYLHHPTTMTTQPPTPAPPTILIAKVFNQDRYLPSRGQFIKIRFDASVPGPASILSASAPSNAAPFTYHTAIVITAVADPVTSRLTIRAFPVPAYSGSSTNPVAMMASQPTALRRLFLPIAPSDLDTTPSEFGAPLNPTYTEAGMTKKYINLIPSWVLLSPMFATIPDTKTWKIISPEVKVSDDEMDRMLVYAHRVNQNNITVLQYPGLMTTAAAVVNCVRLPIYDANPELQDLFKSFGQVYTGQEVMWAGGEDDEENAESGTVGPNEEGGQRMELVDFVRLLPAARENGMLRDMVQRDEEWRKKRQRQLTMDWLQNTVGC
jgi:hypothetical protein